MEIQVSLFIITFILTLFAGPLLIPVLAKLKLGQIVRYDGPATHLKKNGTPTMGGIIFLIPIIILTIFFARTYPKILPLLFVTLGFGAIGFIDDLIKILKKRKDGLYPRQKILGLLLIAVPFAFFIAQGTNIGTDITIPLAGIDITFGQTWAFIFFTVILFLATTNSVNITDGLDGLASGVTLIVMVFFTIVAMTRGEWDYIKVFTSMIAGGCLGFLTFNIHPAKVFMGDTGSLALGGAVGAIALMMKMPFILLIVGAVYMVETLSVIIQVGSFKLRGKRVFRMAPLHHHFELSGWKETRVVFLFWTATAVFCFLGLLALRFRIF